MEILVLIAVAVGASISYLIASERRRAQLSAWRLAAARNALTDVETIEGGFRDVALEGSAGDLRVRLEPYQKGKHEHGTKIVITGLGHGLGGLTLRREGFATAIEKHVIGEREIEIGDPSFDAEYYVQGPAPVALAVLNARTRRRLARLLRGEVAHAGGRSIEVEASLLNGTLEVHVDESGSSEKLESVPAILGAVLDIARLLVAPKDVAGRIAANVNREAEAGARLSNLLMLAREFPDHPATRKALLAARKDASEEVRLRAAIELGKDGRETLVALVSADGLPDSVAARAVAALGDGLSADLAEATLRRALGEPGLPETACACLEALGQQGRAEAEGLMIEALRGRDPQVKAAAARALGRAGTVAAVVALLEAMPPDGDLRPAVGRQAIAEIQSRLQGAAPGQLTLAGGEAGALSLAEDEPGRLSLAEAGRGEAEDEADGHS